MKPAITPHLDVPLIPAPERMSSIIRSPGGKHRLARDLVNLAPFQMTEYRELFAGSAAVAFRMARIGRTRKIWINDLDPGIANMWTMVRDDPAGLIRVLRSLHGRFGAGSKELFDLSVQMVESDDRTEAAAGFYVRNHLSMYGANGMSSYAPSHPRDNRGLRPVHINYIPQFSAWLQGAKITNLDYREVLDAPGAGVMCFVDPPYAQVGKAMYPFGEADLQELARHVRASGYSCLITVDDSPANRVAFSDMHPIVHAFTSNMGNIHKSAELVCANYTTPLYTVHARKIGVEIEQTAPVILPINDVVPVVMAETARKDKATNPTNDNAKSREEQVRNLFVNEGGTAKTCDWYTSGEILAPFYAANENQPFDLDPCSPCKGDNAPVWARQHFTIDDDGLAQEWHGRVWLNAPFNELEPWLEKAADAVWCSHMPNAPTEASANREHPLCETVVSIMPARTHTRYWQKYVRDHARVFFVSGKLKFLRGDGGKGVPVKMPFPEGLAFVIWGNHTPFTDYLNAMPASVLDVYERSAPVIPDHPVRYWNAIKRAA